MGPKINWALSCRERSLLLGGVALPCIMRWPGRIKPNSVLQKPVEMQDILQNDFRQLQGIRIVMLFIVTSLMELIYL